jgi:hypothetical protein
MPGTSISSLVGYMPISASPRWTTSPTRGELLAGGWRNEADLRPGRAGGRLVILKIAGADQKPVILQPRLERSVHSVVLLHGGGFDPHRLIRD